MEALAAYVIPVTTLRNGRNELDFKVDWRFFRHFEDSPVEQGRFDVAVMFDKYLDHWHLFFQVQGAMDTECDRCLAPIALPVSGNFELYVYFETERRDDGESAEVIFVDRETTQFDIAQLLYEYIVLSVPVARRYECENTPYPPCDMEMLARLSQQEDVEQENVQWDVLKKIQSGESN